MLLRFGLGARWQIQELGVQPIALRQVLGQGFDSGGFGGIVAGKDDVQSQFSGLVERAVARLRASRSNRVP